MNKKKQNKEEEIVEQELNINEPQHIIEQEVDELRERRAKYKKVFPYSEFVDYVLSDEEKQFIENLNEKQLKVEDIAEFKRLHKDIWNDNVTVDPNCGACKSQIKAKLVKLKLFRNTQ